MHWKRLSVSLYVFEFWLSVTLLVDTSHYSHVSVSICCSFSFSMFSYHSTKLVHCFEEASSQANKGVYTMHRMIKFVTVYLRTMRKISQDLRGLVDTEMTKLRGKGNTMLMLWREIVCFVVCNGTLIPLI